MSITSINMICQIISVLDGNMFIKIYTNQITKTQHISELIKGIKQDILELLNNIKTKKILKLIKHIKPKNIQPNKDEMLLVIVYIK